ncbi:hypothetical protein A1D23_08095 [Chelonobacter oris]|nr:hypothetical protein [Chelonobacter oris]
MAQRKTGCNTDFSIVVRQYWFTEFLESNEHIIPIFQHTVMAIIAAIITAIIVVMMITAILGFDEKNLNH